MVIKIAHNNLYVISFYYPQPHIMLLEIVFLWQWWQCKTVNKPQWLVSAIATGRV